MSDAMTDRVVVRRLRLHRTEAALRRL